ncbi:MAG: maleylpyruvate isomerase family mycothiol-dependent enzyme [Ktedonobacteraceae bacterium]
MATLELERFLALVTSLSLDDWEKPTACPLWNVQQMLAHVTGAAASYARWSEFKRQNSLRVQRPYRASGLSYLDSLNQIQVNDRVQATPAALIDELRAVGPRAIATRAKLPALLRAIRLPIPGTGGITAIGYLTDLIYTRDMWMHRLDICQTTHCEMSMTTEHDGRITALVIRDLVKQFVPPLRKASIVYTLTGTGGGTWQFGQKGSALTSIKMDALDFHRLASGRLTPEEAWSYTSIDGDTALAREIINRTKVLY